MNLDLTPAEYNALKEAVKNKLSYSEDNAYRWTLNGDKYPWQKNLDTIRSLAVKLGVSK